MYMKVLFKRVYFEIPSICQGCQKFVVLGALDPELGIFYEDQIVM
jgi:hypothetical protein